MALEAMDYVKIVTSSAVIGSTMGALVSGAFAWWKEHRETQRERFSATMTSVETLENYTRACVQMIYTDAEAQEEAGRRHDYGPLDRVSLPPFSYPESVAWKWMKPRIAAQLREFPQARAASKRHIRSTAEYEDPFVVCDTITIACANLGLKGWALATDIRAKTGLPSAEFHDQETGMLDFLREKIRKRAEAQAAWQAKWQAMQNASHQSEVGNS